MASLAADLLAEAATLIDGERNAQHGDRYENFSQIADLWTAYLKHPIRTDQVAMMMVLMKTARSVNGAFSLEDYRDGAGYIALAGELAQAANKPLTPE